MSDDVVREAQDILTAFAGHGWGSGAAGAYRDQGEIDALIRYGPLMLNALRNLVTEVEALRARLDEIDVVSRAQFEGVTAAVIRARNELRAPVAVETTAEPDGEPEDETESQPEHKPSVVKATNKARRR